jgi:hypothetical protein
MEKPGKRFEGLGVEVSIRARFSEPEGLEHPDRALEELDWGTIETLENFGIDSVENDTEFLGEAKARVTL